MISSRSAIALLFLLGLFFLPADAQAQNQLTAGVGLGIVSQGDHLIPSVDLSCSRPVAQWVQAYSQIRFSRLQSLNHEDALQRDRLTYLGFAVGGKIHPIDAGRSQLGVGLGGIVRGRWEYDSIRAFGQGGGRYEVEFENRRSADVGWTFDIAYSVRTWRTLHTSLGVSGNTYNDGPSLFFASLGMHLSL